MSEQPAATAGWPVEDPGGTPQSRDLVGPAAALLAVATAHQLAQNAFVMAVVRQVLALWGSVPSGDLSGGWLSALPRASVLVSSGQQILAAQAPQYVEQAFAVQEILAREIVIDPSRFAGFASDGRSLEGLLVGAAVAAKRRAALGGDPVEVKAAGTAYLTKAVATELGDAARSADSVALIAAGNPSGAGESATVGTERKFRYGWTRMLTPPSCARCVLLAGRFYKWNEGFERHPLCWPASTIVSGPEFLAASRRWYQGKLVTIRTASGEKLSVTANHPVLTTRGWVPAQFVKEGDHVLRSTGSHGATPLVVPDRKEVPTRIEDVFHSLDSVGLGPMPSATEDFHGDGGHGEVDVVFSDRLLRQRFEATGGQHVEQSHLALTGESSDALDGLRALQEGFFGPLGASGGVVSGLGLLSSLVGRHLAGAQEAGFGASARPNIAREQGFADDVARGAGLLADGEFGFSGSVQSLDEVRIGGDLGAGPRWDPLSDSSAMQDSRTDSGRAFDLTQRLAGQVEPDRVVEARSVDWSGHVYSLTSAEGWVCSDNLITSNCDCRHIPTAESMSGDLRVNPEAYFKSLRTAAKYKYFGKANTKAIEAGADFFQVMNAVLRDGSLYTVGARRYTREGTTRRGFYRTVTEAGRAGLPRPTPYQIIRDSAGDQEVAVRLLRQFGYILR